MARTSKNCTKITDEGRAARFQELVTLAMEHFNCKYHNKFVRIMKEYGISMNSEQLMSQLKPTSTPNDHVINRMAELMEKVGVTINKEYVKNGSGSGKGKKGKTLILEDRREKKQQEAEEAQATDDMFNGLTEMSLGDMEDDIQFDFPEDMNGTLDTIENDVKEDGESTMTKEEEKTEDISSENDTIEVEEATVSDGGILEEEEIVIPEIEDEDLGGSNKTENESENDDKQKELAYIPPKTFTEQMIEEAIDKKEKPVAIAVPVVQSSAGKFVAKSAYEKWCDAARELGIKEIDDKGMTITVNGLTHAFAPADDKDPYRQMVLEFTRNGFRTKKVTNYKDDRVKWTMKVMATFEGEIEIEAPSAAAAEEKLKSLGISAHVNGKGMNLVERTGVATNPRKL